MSNSKVLKIGLIVENQSDFETIRELSKKFSFNRKIAFKKALGKGCGRVRSKCNRLAINLKNKGCHRLIIVHDLDEFIEEDLRRQLETLLKPYPINKSVIIIPVRAIEAWLLTDVNAISKTFSYKSRKIKQLKNTEKIEKPKKYLANLINVRMKKRYLNTVHNQKIAKNSNINNVLKCPSFKPLYKFLTN